MAVISAMSVKARGQGNRRGRDGGAALIESEKRYPLKRKYRPPHPMGVKGGCSPQNNLPNLRQLVSELRTGRNQFFRNRPRKQCFYRAFLRENYMVICTPSGRGFVCHSYNDLAARVMRGRLLGGLRPVAQGEDLTNDRFDLPGFDQFRDLGEILRIRCHANAVAADAEFLQLR